MVRSFVAALLLTLLLPGCSPENGAVCQVDEDCPAGNYCRSAECVFDCTHDDECPEGFRCTARGSCERGCVKTNGGVEACDGVDNDCDGATDENFDGLDEACFKGACRGSWVCAADGTTTRCDAPDPAADDATCDGRDDDCDGETDEDAHPRDCPLQEGVCTGARETCLDTGAWSGCDYGPEYSESVDDSCNQEDNDCDGDTDEDAATILQGEFGTQASDGMDNNCNGLVDEPGGAMVRVPGVDEVWIDAYEASVFPDATCQGTQHGAAVDDYPAEWPTEGTPTVTLYACSLPGVLPSGHLSWHRARWACEAQGKRLCRGTEWSFACTGLSIRFFPYGGTFVPGMCNDALGGAGEVRPTGFYEDCLSLSGTYDMSGNLAEWLRDWDDSYPDNAVTAGFYFRCELCEGGTGCRPCDGSDGDLREIEQESRCDATQTGEESFPRSQAKDVLGTRCCLDGPP